MNTIIVSMSTAKGRQNYYAERGRDADRELLGKVINSALDRGITVTSRPVSENEEKHRDGVDDWPLHIGCATFEVVGRLL